LKYRDCFVVGTDIPTYHLFMLNEADRAFAMARARSARNNTISKALGG